MTEKDRKPLVPQKTLVIIIVVVMILIAASFAARVAIHGFK